MVQVADMVIALVRNVDCAEELHERDRIYLCIVSAYTFKIERKAKDAKGTIFWIYMYFSCVDVESFNGVYLANHRFWHCFTYREITLSCYVRVQTLKNYLKKQI